MTKRSKRRHSPLPRIFIGLGLIVVSIVVVVVVMRKNLEIELPNVVEPAPALVDYPAPELVLSDLSGNSISLNKLTGRVILVNNWATWCPPCRAEMSTLQAYAQAHLQDDFILVGINAGDKDEQVIDFINEYQLTFPICLDPTGKALQAFQNNALPSSYVVDRTGMVRMVWMGRVTLEALEAYVTPLFVK